MANLYKRTDGSLVIALSPPSGGTLVTVNTGDALSINAPLYRTLDSSAPTQFHPAIYSAASETNLLDRPLQARFDLVNANIASVSADISDTYSRVVTDAQQTVSRVASLEASYNGTVAAQAVISYNQTVLTNADLAMATQINLMQAAYGDAYASLTDINTALATATTSLAERTSTIEGSLDGNTASIKTTQSVVNGINATYAVTINNNGSLSGFALTSDAATNGGVATSAFYIAADKFAIVDPSTSYSGTTPPPSAIPFSISGGVTYIKEANILTLNGSKLMPTTVAKVRSSSAGTASLPNGTVSYTIIGTLSLSIAHRNVGQFVAVTISFSADMGGTALRSLTIGLGSNYAIYDMGSGQYVPGPAISIYTSTANSNSRSVSGTATFVGYIGWYADLFTREQDYYFGSTLTATIYAKQSSGATVTVSDINITAVDIVA